MGGGKQGEAGKRREEYKEGRKEGHKSSTVCELAKRDFLFPRKNQTPGRKQTVFRKLILC